MFIEFEKDIKGIWYNKIEMEYTQFSREHMMDCMANQSALIDQFYIELKEKRRIKRLNAKIAMAAASAKKQSHTQSINIKWCLINITL